MSKERMTEVLLECFPKGFVNRNGEFIAHKKSNTYLNLEKCEDWLDLSVAVIENFSRAAYKTEPYYSDAANAKFHRFMLDGINRFMAPKHQLTHEDMELVYTYLGWGVHRSLTVQFVESDCDMEVLREYERSKA